MRFRLFLCMIAAAGVSYIGAAEQHYLYVAEPGIRNYVQYGGVGVLVFDIDHGYKFVRRIPTWETEKDKEPENVKGIAASARTGKLYVTTFSRAMALDLATDKKVWDRAYEGGCDRLAISPDGALLYIPSFEGPHWNVVDAATGEVIKKVVTKSGSHNTIYSRDGRRVFMAGLRSPYLSISGTEDHTVIQTVGPFSKPVRPFTINGSGTRVFVNVNDLAGFEVGDVQTGKMLARVEIPNYKPGQLKRHGCPSHGIAMTANEKELWVVDGANDAVHIFDATVMPPRYVTAIKLRDFPGWISFSIDGRKAYSSTGEIIDTESRKVVATLTDEEGRQVQSEKVVEIDFDHAKVIRAGDQFGVGKRP